MSIKPLLVLPLLAFGLAGCLETQGERTAVGAVGGAVVADAVGIDPVVGAVAGGAGGYFCRDIKLCRK